MYIRRPMSNVTWVSSAYHVNFCSRVNKNQRTLQLVCIDVKRVVCHTSQTNETVKNVFKPDKCLTIMELPFYFLNGFIPSFSFSPAEFFIDLCYLCFSSFCPCHDIFTSRLNCLATMHLEMKLKEYNLHMECVVHEWRSILVRKQTQNRYLNKWFLMKKRIPW